MQSSVKVEIKKKITHHISNSKTQKNVLDSTKIPNVLDFILPSCDLKI